MCKVIVFAGTTEGREIAEFLERRQIPGHICVATEYGEQLLPESPVLEISHQRLARKKIRIWWWTLPTLMRPRLQRI